MFKDPRVPPKANPPALSDLQSLSVEITLAASTQQRNSYMMICDARLVASSANVCCVVKPDVGLHLAFLRLPRTLLTKYRGHSK